MLAAELTPALKRLPGLKRLLDQEGEQLVPRAEQLLATVDISALPTARLFADLKSLGREIHNDHHNPAVALNCLEGIVGNDTAAESWRRPIGSQSLGVLLLDELRQPSGQVARSLARIQQTLRLTDPLKVRQLRMHLIKGFLRFFAAHLSYLALQNEPG